MNILFLTLVQFDSLKERNIYTDLLQEFVDQGHFVYAISPTERRQGKETHLSQDDECAKVLRLRIGNTQKTNLVEKGISTITLEQLFIHAIKAYTSQIRFDLVLYSTPPITLCNAVQFVKKRDGAKTYLLLKDIFPQNSVDLGMLKKSGIKGMLYQMFRKKEKKLYRISDYIGCMSPANVAYVRAHNELASGQVVEVNPNCIRPSAADQMEAADPNGTVSAVVEQKGTANLNGTISSAAGQMETLDSDCNCLCTAGQRKNGLSKNTYSVEEVVMPLPDAVRCQLRKRYGLPEDKVIFLYGGNLGRPQDVGYIVECLRACEAMTEIFFVIAGSGTDQHILQEYIDREHPSHVKLMPQMPRDDYEKMVRCCDVGLIFLDHRFTIPNFPSRLLSYLDAGLPVLAATDQNTDIGTVICEGGFGAWCESVSTEQFVSCVRVFLDAEKRTEMGSLAREYLEQHYTAWQGYEIIIKHFV